MHADGDRGVLIAVAGAALQADTPLPISGLDMPSITSFPSLTDAMHKLSYWSGYLAALSTLASAQQQDINTLKPEARPEAQSGASTSSGEDRDRRDPSTRPTISVRVQVMPSVKRMSVILELKRGRAWGFESGARPVLGTYHQLKIKIRSVKEALGDVPIDIALLDRMLGPSETMKAGVNAEASRYLTGLINTRRKFDAVRAVLAKSR
jgi:hypothetical protein